MRKALIIVAVLFGLLAAAGVGGLFYVGNEAEQRFDATLERFSSPPNVVVKKIRYERGLLGAEAETAVEFAAGPLTIAIPLTHSISYMPLATASGWAEVRSELMAPAAIKPLVDKMFGGASPLTGVTLLNFDGSEVTQFQSPPFSLKDAGGNVSWQGINGTLTVQGPHVVINATAPGLKGESPALSAALQNLTLDVDMTQAADELWLGTSSMRFGKLEVGGTLVPAFSGEGLRLKSETAEQSAGLLRSSVSVDLKRLAMQDKTFTNMGLELEASNLDRAVLVRLSKAMDNFKPGSGQAEAESVFTGALPQLLKRSPAVAVKRMNAVTPWGDLKGNINVAFDGKGELPSAMLMWIGRVKVDAKVDASATFLRWLLEEQVRNLQLANSGTGAMSSAPDLAAVRLSRLEKAGALVSEGERYTINIQLADGVITVNGRPVNELAAQME